MEKKLFPKITNLELTNCCNFDCPICVEKNSEKGFLDMEILKKIVEKNKDYLKGQKIWLHFRGESLLHKDFKSIVKLLTAADISTGLSTNGLLLKSKIDEIIKSKISKVVISVITNNKKKYQELRGNSNYEIIAENVGYISELMKRKVLSTDFQIMGLDYNQSREEIKDFINYYHALGFDVAMHRYSDRLNYSRHRVDIDSKKNKKRLACEWPFSKMIILYNGDVTTCYYDLGGRMIMGNLKDYDYSIFKIWNSPQYEKMRNEQAKIKFERECKFCSDWKYEHSQIKDKNISYYLEVFPLKGDSYKI